MQVFRVAVAALLLSANRTFGSPVIGGGGFKQHWNTTLNRAEPSPATTGMTAHVSHEHSNRRVSLNYLPSGTLTMPALTSEPVFESITRSSSMPAFKSKSSVEPLTQNKTGPSHPDIVTAVITDTVTIITDPHTTSTTTRTAHVTVFASESGDKPFSTAEVYKSLFSWRFPLPKLSSVHGEGTTTVSCPVDLTKTNTISCALTGNSEPIKSTGNSRTPVEESKSKEIITETKPVVSEQNATSGLVTMSCGCSYNVERGYVDCPFSGMIAPSGPCASKTTIVTRTHRAMTTEHLISSATFAEAATVLDTDVVGITTYEPIPISNGSVVKREASTEPPVITGNPTSALASILSATGLWPASISPDMAPTGTPSINLHCRKSLDGKYQLYELSASSPGQKLSKRDGGLIYLINGTLMDERARIGNIVANGQFQFDLHSQAGAKYTAGWTACTEDNALVLTLGGNSTFWVCRSGGFVNFYYKPTTDDCSLLRLGLIEFNADPTSSTFPAPTLTERDAGQDAIWMPSPQAWGYYSTVVEGSVTTSIAIQTAFDLKPSGIVTATANTVRYDNHWAYKVETAGETHTFWDPYPVLTVSGTVYSIDMVTRSPSSVTPTSSNLRKRAIGDGAAGDMPYPLDYEENTYTITIAATSGADPVDPEDGTGSPISTSSWTIPARTVTIKEHPFTTTAATAAATKLRRELETS